LTTCLNVTHATVSNTGTMYAATTCNQVDAVFRSFDRGLTWQSMPALPGGRLVTYPRLGHSLATVREDVLDRLAAFLESIGGNSISPG
jgi:hypothetical protein